MPYAYPARRSEAVIRTEAIILTQGTRAVAQLLHLVFGGELTDLSGEVNFADLEKLDIVGIYPNYRTAYAAWRGAAQKTVDNAHMRYFIVHIHRLLDPEKEGAAPD